MLSKVFRAMNYNSQKGEKMERVNSSIIYSLHCRNFYGCHNLPLLSTKIKTKNENLTMSEKKKECQSRCINKK
jgi:hypothetical protein